MSCIIEFEKLSWNEPAVGIKSKTFVNGNQQIRLVEFSDGFVEPDWCEKGHAGYVLDGEFSTVISGKLERYKKGDIIFIPEGERSKHKAVLGAGERVLLLLFEII